MKSTRKKGGRPPKAPDQKRKYVLPKVRVNTHERFLVNAMAREAGASKAEVIRQLIRKGKIAGRISPKLLDIYHQLAGIANNQNQLAHKANIGGYAADSVTYRENALKVRKLINKLIHDSENQERE
jgi:hypothetical protein